MNYYNTEIDTNELIQKAYEGLPAYLNSQFDFNNSFRNKFCDSLSPNINK